MKVSKGTGTDADGGGAEGAGAGEGAGVEEEEGVEDSGPLALALQVPRKVIVGSSRFQQFFFIYAKLMAGLRDSKVSESETTPLDMQSAVMRAGKSSREELDWAICEIWPEMSEPTSMFIFITKSNTNLALSILRSDV